MASNFAWSISFHWSLRWFPVFYKMFFSLAECVVIFLNSYLHQHFSRFHCSITIMINEWEVVLFKCHHYCGNAWKYICWLTMKIRLFDISNSPERNKQNLYYFFSFLSRIICVVFKTKRPMQKRHFPCYSKRSNWSLKTIVERSPRQSWWMSSVITPQKGISGKLTIFLDLIFFRSSVIKNQCSYIRFSWYFSLLDFRGSFRSVDDCVVKLSYWVYLQEKK